MARRLAWADLATAAAGGTLWELARVGTPTLAIVLAENQWPGAAAFAREGAAVNLGWHTEVRAEDVRDATIALADDADRRTKLSRRAQALVDGRGALRVLAAMGLLDEDAVAA
jgi:spore coat polysaccharide biosynthesis predicted glycosyltransferase SpsG